MAAMAVAVLGLLLASCSTPHHPAEAAAAPTAPAAPAPAPSSPPEPYVRVVHPDTNTVELQIAVRKFVPHGHRGPTVWLAGVSHVGDPEYYHALQRHLDAQTLVLYEGVHAENHKRRVRGIEKPDASAAPAQPSAAHPAETSATSSSAATPGLQAALAESLGLVFQLDAIDYDRTNFLNSDLSIQEIAKLMGGQTAPSGEPGPAPSTGSTNTVAAPASANPSFNLLLQAMDGTSFLGQLMKAGVQLIGSSASLRAIAKLTFIETIGQLRGDLSTVRGVPPDMQELVRILIEARNQNVIEDLKTESRTLPRSASVAIFYGTGHMDDMEKRLARDLDYHPADEIWFTAFSVDVRQTGLSASQLQMVRGFIKRQMDQLQQ